VSKRILFIVVVITLSFGLPAAYGLGDGNEKVGALQKIKSAYNDFRSRQQQKSQAVKNEAPKKSPAPKVAASKIESPKVESSRAAAPKAQTKDKEVTKEEMLAELKEDLSDNDEVFDAISELKAIAGQNGNAVYTYKDTVLDELSKEGLTELYGRVRRALVKIRTDRIERQLETIKQVERFQRVANPPQPPRIPAAPPSAPRTPSSPPPAPQRR